MTCVGNILRLFSIKVLLVGWCVTIWKVHCAYWFFDIVICQDPDASRDVKLLYTFGENEAVEEVMGK